MSTVRTNHYPKWVTKQYEGWIIGNYLVANKDDIDSYIRDVLLAYDPNIHGVELSLGLGLWNYEYFIGENPP